MATEKGSITEFIVPEQIIITNNQVKKLTLI